MKDQMKKVAKKAVKSHEDKMHKGKKKMAMGGKTGYAKGGLTSEGMKSMGRGMAKVKNQGGR